jgi:hypothetical protein
MQDVKWLQTITSLPILVKGVVTAEDSKCSVSDFQTSEMQPHFHISFCNDLTHETYATQLDLQLNMVLLGSLCPIMVPAN